MLRASELTALASGLYPHADALDSTALLTTGSWMVSQPVALNDIDLDWIAGPERRLVDGTEPEAQRLLPLRAPGHQFDRYSSAVRYLDRPTLFENRPTYRLLRLALSERPVHLGFSLGTYFELVDVGQAAAHELAAAHMRYGQRLAMHHLPFRSLIGDPFDLPRRAVQSALDVLTIRLDRRSGNASFFLHWRDPAKVAVGGGLYSAIPVGVFQPSSIASEAVQQDFDLWRNLVREFSEELLGMPEHDGSSGAMIDYDHWPLYRTLTHACASRRLRIFCFGVGLNPLWLGTDILAAIVIDAEGQVVSGLSPLSIEGIPFTQEHVHRFLTSKPMGPGGAACLMLAWQHRGTLLDDQS